MSSNIERIRLLEIELNNLQFKQTTFTREIEKLRTDILSLKQELTEEEQLQSNPIEEIILTQVTEVFTEKTIETNPTGEIKETVREEIKKETIQNFWENRKEFITPKKENSIQRDLEKFIGENLMSKIGIGILILGVGIGLKYSIDHNLISPLMRLILGYILGIELLGIGIKLKEKFNQFSAVLVSGSMAVNYLITYFGYSFYHLIPQGFAFVLLLALTVFTVITAIKYNQQMIAHIGFVGAYVIPFLLSSGSNNHIFFLSYIALINAGILAVSYFKNWKPLNLISFLFTWITFVIWVLNYNSHEHRLLGLTFASIFFLEFYAIFLLSKIANKLSFESKDITPVISNTTFYFLTGYTILNDADLKDYQGLFSIVVGCLHFIAALIIKRYSSTSNNQLFYLPLGLVFVFITIAIPIQLEGSPVVLLWITEAVVLFYLARKKSIEFYEFFAYPILILGIGTYFNDTFQAYQLYDNENITFKSLLNIHFLTSILVSLGVSFFALYNIKTSKKHINNTLREINEFTGFLLPFAAIGIIYLSFFFELNAYFDLKIIHSYTQTIAKNTILHQINIDYIYLKKVWNFNYSIVFLLLLFVIEYKIIKKLNFKSFITGTSILTVLLFLTIGLYNLGELAFSYINDAYTPYFENGISNIYQRYLSYVLIGILLITIKKNLKLNALDWTLVDNNKMFDIILATTVIWLLSSELVIWMDITHFSSSFKLILSILWGIYAVILIVIGIAKGKQHIRIGALTLFSVTLIKLFFYDIAHLDTISKTIVFLTLGVLLLITSFLYNKFKHLINPNE
jgi:uncharacterized membrane protein